MNKKFVISLTVFLVAGSLVLALWGRTHSMAVVGLFLLAVGLSYTVSTYYPKLKKSKVFGSREPLSPDKFYRQFYASEKVDQTKVTGIVAWVAKVLDLPPDKLRPSDRFGVELGPFWYVDDPIDQLEREIRAKAGKGSDVAWLAQVKTLDQLIRVCIEHGIEA